TITAPTPERAPTSPSIKQPTFTIHRCGASSSTRRRTTPKHRAARWPLPSGLRKCCGALWMGLSGRGWRGRTEARSLLGGLQIFAWNLQIQWWHSSDFLANANTRSLRPARALASKEDARLNDNALTLSFGKEVGQVSVPGELE